MTKPDLKQLTNEKLQLELKTSKTSFQSLAVIVFIMILVAVFSTVKNGFGFFTFFPLIWFFLCLASWNKYKEIVKEIESRR